MTTKREKKLSTGEQDSLISRWHTILRLMAFLWKLNPLGVCCIGIMLLIDGLIPIFFLSALRHAIDDVMGTASTNVSFSAASIWLIAIVGLTILDQLIGVGSRWLSLTLEEEAKASAQEHLLQKAGSLSLAPYEDHRFYDLLQRAQRGIDQYLYSVSISFPAVIIGLLNAISILLYVGSSNFLFDIIFIFTVVPFMVIDARYGRKRWRMERKQTADERFQLYTEDLMTQRRSAAEIRLFGLQGYLLDNWRGRFSRLQAEQRELARKSALSGLIGQIYIPLAMFFTTSAVTFWVEQGTMTVGYFATYISAVGRFTSALWQLVSSTTKLNNELRYIKDLFEYLDLTENLPQTPLLLAPAPEMLPAPSNGSKSVVEPGREALPTIQFESVSFMYPGSASLLLDSIDLTLNPGERIALVGENGAGKTTLAKLLLGLYQPTSGRILVNGHNLVEMDPQSWKQCIAAVFQDYMRYALTARENIGFGKISSVDNVDAIKRAAAKSGADMVIENLPAAYNTILGKIFDDTGSDLSTGQWQKLAIARAYLREAQVLVLDEPTAALDARAEVDIYRQFRDMAEGKSVLFISHRLGSARLADRIILLSNGRITEQGNHDELMRLNGIYAHMYTVQASWYLDQEEIQI